MSSISIVLETCKLDYEEIKILNFGDYMQAHQPWDIINDNKARTIGVMALHPSGKLQESWYFMSLTLGERLHRYQWHVLPIRTEIINRLHKIAIKEAQPFIKGNFELNNMRNHGDDVTDEDNDNNNYDVNRDNENEINETRLITYNNDDSGSFENDDVDTDQTIDINDDDNIKMIKSEVKYYNNNEYEDNIIEQLTNRPNI